MKLRRAGDHAVLLELEDNAAVHALAAAVRDRFAELVEDVVPGHRTLLVTWPEGADGDGLHRALSELGPAAVRGGAESVGPEVRIAVRYDGPDLPAVADSAGVAVDEVVEIHARALYTAAFVGFAPGFAYLIGGDQRLAVPRRATPRVKVPGGAVALAGAYSAVYPAAGPGGWQIIGHTDAVLFDLRRTQPTLIPPGSRVRFEPV